MDAAGLADLVKPNFEVAGVHDRYSFDFALVNGSPKRIIEAQSLTKEDREAVRSEIHATGYRVQDIRDNNVFVPSTSSYPRSRVNSMNSRNE